VRPGREYVGVEGGDGGVMSLADVVGRSGLVFELLSMHSGTVVFSTVNSI
jgi:hypothetical protein